MSAPRDGGGRASVLMYHRLADRPFDPEEGDYVLPAGLFARQLDLLAALGRAVFLPSASSGDAVPDGSVMLTFDDGCESDFRDALPLLRERGLRAAFFVNPARLGEPGRMTWEQVEALAAAGMAVGSHGLDHTLLDDLSGAEMERQLGLSRELLERRLRRPVEWLSLPGGSGGSRAAGIARTIGYRLVFGSRPGLLDTRRLRAVVPRWALRRGHGLEGFRAIVEQRRGLRLRASLRFTLTRLARTAVGTDRYARWRRLWVEGESVDRAGNGGGR